MSMPDYISDKGERLFSIRETVPSNIEDMEGDAFAPRNDYAMGIDFKKKPPIYKYTDTHFVYSWLYDKKAPKFELPPVIAKAWKGGH